jgi:hypothetical protein
MEFTALTLSANIGDYRDRAHSGQQTSVIKSGKLRLEGVADSTDQTDRDDIKYARIVL